MGGVLSFKLNMSHHEIKEKRFKVFDKLVWYYFEVTDETRNFIFPRSSFNTEPISSSWASWTSLCQPPSGNGFVWNISCKGDTQAFLLAVLSLTVSYHVGLDTFFQVAALGLARRSSPEEEEEEEQQWGEEPASEAAGPLCLGWSPHTSFRGQRWAHGPVACVESSLCFPSLSRSLMNRPLATVGPLWESTFGQKRKKEGKKKRDRRRERHYLRKKKKKKKKRRKRKSWAGKGVFQYSGMYEIPGTMSSVSLWCIFSWCWS